MLTHNLPNSPQAFSIPVIQIVYETLKDQQEGKKGRATVKTGGASENILIFRAYWIEIFFAFPANVFSYCCTDLYLVKQYRDRLSVANKHHHLGTVTYMGA